MQSTRKIIEQSVEKNPKESAMKIYDGVKHHIFLCTGEKCSSKERNLQLWEYLKKKCNDLNNINPVVARSKTDCLRVCVGGPLALVYPEGVFYGNLDEKKIDLIIDEHIIKGNILLDMAFYQVHFSESAFSVPTV